MQPSSQHNITKLPSGNEVLMAFFIIITCGEAVLSIWTEPKKETPHHSLPIRYHREVEVQLFIHSASTTFPFMGSQAGLEPIPASFG